MKKPLYITIADRLRKAIFAGDFLKENRLLSEPILSKRLGVSRTTLREALKGLESEGIIHRVHGIGTFVKAQSPSLPLGMTIPRSLTSMINSLGLSPGVKDAKLTTEIVFPDDVDKLGISPGAEVIRIIRTRTANSQPVAYTIDVMPRWVMKVFPQMDTVSNFSLIEHLTIRCGIKMTETSSTLIPLHHVQSVADKLEIEPSSHIFFFEGIDYDTEGRPVLLSREYFAPGIFSFRVKRTPD